MIKNPALIIREKFIGLLPSEDLTGKMIFRASGSGIIDYEKSMVDLDAVKLAFKISSKLKFKSMAYDIIYDHERNPQIIEVSYTFVADAIAKCPGYWDSDLNWHKGHFSPQYFQLLDALGLQDLKHP